MCAWTPDTVPPLTDTEGVVAPNVATASLNSTTTCGRSPEPVCVEDEDVLVGKVADSPVVVTVSASTVAVAALVRLSLFPVVGEGDAHLHRFPCSAAVSV